MLIRRLERSDRRDSFSSGDRGIDEFLRRLANQNQNRHHIGVTYVAIDDATRIVFGYVTVSSGSMSNETLPPEIKTRFPHYPLPILRIARLGVTQEACGEGIGSALLRYAFDLALVQAERSGCAGMLVDALPESVGFYEQFGFVPCRMSVGGSARRPRPAALFLPLAAVRLALDE